MPQPIKISKSKLNPNNLDETYNYLISAGLTEEDAEPLMKEMRYLNGIYKDKNDSYNNLLNENPQYADDIKLKGIIDNRISTIEAATNNKYSFNDDSNLKEYAKLVSNLYKDDMSLSYYTSDYERFNKIVESFGGRGKLYDLGIHTNIDNNGQYTIYLDSDKKENTKYFIDAIKGIENNYSLFSKARLKGGKFGNFDKENKRNLMNNAAYDTNSISNTISKLNSFYKKLDDRINKHVNSDEITIMTENLMFAGQNPYVTDLMSMAAGSTNKNEIDAYNKMIAANTELYDNLFRSSSINLAEYSIEERDEKSNTFKNIDDKSSRKLELINKFQRYLANNGKLYVNSMYNAYNGQIKPVISFIDPDDKEKTIQFSGNFIQGDSYDQYNNSAEFIAASDVEHSTRLNKPLTIGFKSNKTDVDSYQLVPTGDGNFALSINGNGKFNINDSVFYTNKENANRLRQDYNDLITAGKYLSSQSLTNESLTTLVSKYAQDLRQDFYNAFGADLNIDYANIVMSLLNL